MIAHLCRVAYSIVREKLSKPATRSSEWPKVRAHWIEKHGICAACGSILHLQVHHKMPFHDDPTKELDPTNFITLCMDKDECHLQIGHGGSFRKFNPNVAMDAAKALANPEDMQKIKKLSLKAAVPNDPAK